MWQRQLIVVFSKPKYVFTAILTTWIIFTFSVLLPNFQLISVVLFSKTASAIDKISFFYSLYGSIGTNFSIISALFTVIVSILFGINIALLLYYIRRMRGIVSSVKSTSAASIGGLISGVFGVGCAACGTFILTSTLTLIGTGGIFSYFPFKGVEFGFIGIVLLLYSTNSLINKIDKPLLC